MSKGRIADRAAIVTGAANGIGLERILTVDDHRPSVTP